MSFFSDIIPPFGGSEQLETIIIFRVCGFEKQEQTLVVKSGTVYVQLQTTVNTEHAPGFSMVLTVYDREPGKSTMFVVYGNTKRNVRKICFG